MQREKNRTENSILEYMKKSTMRREKKITMQREMAELNRLKQIKNRKYSWPGQLAVYSQPVEVTLYLTFHVKNGSWQTPIGNEILSD
jgi:hypothetical protein